MGRVTVLLSGVPKYVTLIDLSYYLEYIFNTNSEIGTFELRHLPREDNLPLVAIDFRSGFDAIAAQEQLDGYRYEMQDGCQYVLRARITNKKEYLTGDSSPECSGRSTSPAMENEAGSALAMISTMSDSAVFRANAKLDAKYKLLQKQKLIVQTEMELIRERRRLRREYARRDLLDSDDEPACSSSKPRSRSTSREPRSWSQEVELFQMRQAARIQELKATDSYAKEFASSHSKPRSPCDVETGNHLRFLERSKLKSSLLDRRLRTCRSRSRVRSRVTRSRSLSRSPPYRSKSRERSFKKYSSKSKVRSRVVRSRSLTRSPAHSTRSRSRTSSPKNRRSRSRVRRYSKRSRSRDTESREKCYKRISRERKRSRNRRSNKRLRSPESGSRSRRSRSRSRSRRPRLLAIMSKSPPKTDTAIASSRVNGSEVEKSEVEVIIMKKRTKRENSSPKHTGNHKANKPRNSKIKTKTDILKNNCTVTCGPTNINNNEDNKHEIPPTTNITVHTYRKRTSKLEETKSIDTNNRGKNTDEKIVKNGDVKDNETKQKTETAQEKGVRYDKKTIQAICDDIMFLTLSLLLEISIKEDIAISDSNAELMKEKLKILIEERVKILHLDEKFTIRNACEDYRKICTKQDDTILLKKMLNEIKTQGDSSILGKATDDSSENVISDTSKSSNVEESTVTLQHGSLQNNETNEVQVIERESLETSNEHKTAEVVEVIDLETYCPKESSIKEKQISSKKEKSVPDRPKFVLVTKKLMKQLKPVLLRSRENGVYVNYYNMKQVLKILLTEMLKGEGYKTTGEIVGLFRQKYPKRNDLEFIKKVENDINMNKYELEGYKDLQDGDDDDVIVIERKSEIVTVEDTDDESDEQTDNSIYKQNDSEIVKEAGKSNIEQTEIGDAVVKQEQQLCETEQNPKPVHICTDSNSLEPINTDSMTNKEAQNPESEVSDVNKEKQDSLKVTAITIMTSETELHSIANLIENEDPKETIKEEIDAELTDADIDKLLNIDNFNLDMLNTFIETELNVSVPDVNTIDVGEKEIPQVTAITIMTSAYELLSLNHDDNGCTAKDVPEVKLENIIDDNVIQTSEVLVENLSNEAFGNTANVETICPEPQDKPIDDEEETIESICKYLTTFCDGL